MTLPWIVPATKPELRALAPHHDHGCDLVAPHWPYRAGHLDRIRSEMLRRGWPVIRAWWDRDAGVWRAIEGSHRIAVAAELGKGVSIVEVEWQDTFQHDQPDVGVITVARMITERVGQSTAFYELVP